MGGKQCDDSFDCGIDGKTVMNWFVQVTTPSLFKQRWKQGFPHVYKVTDYKSAVKYHGEYIVYSCQPRQPASEIPN
ncbi:DUF2913 family protein [Vibrio lentus]|nr:DUF2913 family protein [Vibrio lentus]